MQQQS